MSLIQPMGVVVGSVLTVLVFLALAPPFGLLVALVASLIVLGLISLFMLGLPYLPSVYLGIVFGAGSYTLLTAVASLFRM